MQELINNVVKWGQERGLDKVGHEAQARKTLEETAELLEAYAKQDINAINDAIGDILVTLIVGASNDDDILDAVEDHLVDEAFGYDEPFTKHDGDFDESYIDLLKDGLILMRDLACEVNYKACIYCLDEALAIINTDFNQHLSLQDCLKLAYNEIKNRTGKLVNGQFIKDN